MKNDSWKSSAHVTLLVHALMTHINAHHAAHVFFMIYGSIYNYRMAPRGPFDVASNIFKPYISQPVMFI